MPNIYLRLPLSRCQFFRHRETDYILQHDNQWYLMPTRTNTSSCEIRSSMLLQKTAMWIWLVFRSNSGAICSRARSAGGKVLMPRDANSWLTYNEVQQLNGRKDFAKGLNEDYLCIRLPSEVEMIDTVYHVKPTFTLDTQGVRQLVVSLNNTFKRSLIEWALSTFDFCTSKGKVIARSRSSMLERYLMRYGIENSEAEKDNLRRIIVRWFKTEHINYQSYSCADMQFGDTRDKMTHIDGIQWL